MVLVIVKNMQNADSILIDRGDLSKEFNIEDIP